MQYLAQILFAVLTAVFMFILIPRARGVGRADPRGPRDGADDPRAGASRSARATRAGAARSCSTTSSSAIPAPRSRSCATSRSGPARARRPRSSAAPAAARRRWSTSSRASTTRPAAPSLVDGVDVRADGPRGSVAGGSGSFRRRRSCSPGRWPATCASVTRARPTRSCGTRSTSPRRRSSSRRWTGGLEAPITQGGSNLSGGQRQRLAIARALVKKAGDLRLRRQLLGARLRNRRAPARGARARGRLGDADHRRPAGRDDHARPTGSWSWMAGGSSAVGTHRELLESNETYREIVYSQMSEKEAAA